MHYRQTIVSLLVLAWIPSVAPGDDAKFVVVGYLPEYQIENVTPENLTPITDLVLFGLEPPADGRLSASTTKRSVLERLHEIKRVADCRLLICVGVWKRSGGFPALAKSEPARRRFIEGLLAYCRNNGFDGVDFDWEHPKGASELMAYGRLLSETKVAFRDSQLLVTVAQAGWQNLGDAAYSAVDRVHLMSYDHDFPQATIEKSKADVDHLVGWGCPVKKIAMGMPFYGRNRGNESRTYGQLVRHRVVDPKVDCIGGFAFNGKATIARKVEFAIKRNLAGVMIWELAQDASQREASLLTTIDQQIQSSVSNQVTNE